MSLIDVMFAKKLSFKDAVSTRKLHEIETILHDVQLKLARGIFLKHIVEELLWGIVICSQVLFFFWKR